MPPATNEPSSPDPDADERGSDDADRDAGDEGPYAEGAPRSDTVRTARLALRAMLGPRPPSPGEEDSPSDDPAENAPS